MQEYTDDLPLFVLRRPRALTVRLAATAACTEVILQHRQANMACRVSPLQAHGGDDGNAWVPVTSS